MTKLTPQNKRLYFFGNLRYLTNLVYTNRLNPALLISVISEEEEEEEAQHVLLE